LRKFLWCWVGGLDCRYDVTDDVGVRVGFILVNTAAGSLDAHCERHKGGPLACAINRTYRRKDLS
jgi:hypothetical protein